ncbi:MAG: tetratricopeptide repeat protein, partial [Alistipes sp.]|nr:tetratricopeptide repeat protein [Alistipes sp.]
EALAIYRCLAENNYEAFDSYLASTLYTLGNLHCNIEEYQTAEKECREALEIYLRLNRKVSGLYEYEIQILLEVIPLLQDTNSEIHDA